MASTFFFALFLLLFFYQFASFAPNTLLVFLFFFLLTWKKWRSREKREIKLKLILNLNKINFSTMQTSVKNKFPSTGIYSTFSRLLSFFTSSSLALSTCSSNFINLFWLIGHFFVLSPCKRLREISSKSSPPIKIKKKKKCQPVLSGQFTRFHRVILIPFEWSNLNSWTESRFMSRKNQWINLALDRFEWTSKER